MDPRLRTIFSISGWLGTMMPRDLLSATQSQLVCSCDNMYICGMFFVIHRSSFSI
ncbi:hypothetical protein BDZ89DRAFT_1162351 [Hymenopellis radicata]|nr:hypothetical protein BDZ89DRAFT_1162351 [Hymenopellis radicata]